MMFGWLVGWLCFTSHRQRGHLETAPPFTVPCEGRDEQRNEIIILLIERHKLNKLSNFFFSKLMLCVAGPHHSGKLQGREKRGCMVKRTKQVPLLMLLILLILHNYMYVLDVYVTVCYIQDHHF